MKIALIGDIHGSWNSKDVKFFNQSDYDYLFFTGDLPPYYMKAALLVKRLHGLNKKSFLIPGNNDTTNFLQLAGEIFNNEFLIEKAALGHDKRINEFLNEANGITICGYSLHPLKGFDMIAARPFSMGGGFNFKPTLQKKYGVGSLESSAQLLYKLIDISQNPKIIFLAHNGPEGLGTARDDIWGKDFDLKGGDLGDQDLRLAIEYARGKGKKILCVLAGHLHYSERNGKPTRNWYIVKDSIHYVNAARVPRIYHKKDGAVHHHISIEIKDNDEIIVEPKNVVNGSL